MHWVIRFTVLSLIILATGIIWKLARRGSALQQGWRRPVAITGIALVGLYFGLSWTTARLLTHPLNRPILCTPGDIGIANYEAVTLTSSDGVHLQGWYIPPENGATIILLHGIGTNRSIFLMHTAMLVSNGYGVMMFDFRDHGESDSAVSTLGYDEVNDVQAALDYVLARPETDPTRIGIIGRSMGGATAIRAAAQMPEIGALVTESTFTSLDEMTSNGVRYLTGLPAWAFAPPVVWLAERETGVAVEQVRPVDVIASISPRPLLLLHGEEDAFIPVAHAEALYAAAQEPKALYRFGDAGHVGLIRSDPAGYERVVIDFFDQSLLGGDQSAARSETANACGAWYLCENVGRFMCW